MKDAISESDAILFVSPEYNRSIPGALKNAIDWASRPWGQNSFDNMPAAVIGASIGQIGTAMAQQSLRGVLSFCNARQMTTPEAYIQYSPEVFTDDGEVTNESTGTFWPTTWPSSAPTSFEFSRSYPAPSDALLVQRLPLAVAQVDDALVAVDDGADGRVAMAFFCMSKFYRSVRSYKRCKRGWSLVALDLGCTPPPRRGCPD